ncbi:hypothetical protein NPIL_462891 [Nephila pilipes]|uniref:Uncharacterized protein n=1 Tax=Nephila pilipes TaxID=299642 RepID=A0A8X6UE23_NEPPI|nr:hypothetical protein NPIL_462891 [Nephila pilipes]
MPETSETQPAAPNVPQVPDAPQTQVPRTQSRFGRLIKKPKFLNYYISDWGLLDHTRLNVVLQMHHLFGVFASILVFDVLLKPEQRLIVRIRVIFNHVGGIHYAIEYAKQLIAKAKRSCSINMFN